MADDYSQTLKIASEKHDITGVRVYDEKEVEIPNLGVVQMQDAETGELIFVNTGSKKVRREYADYYKSREAYYNEAFRKSGAGSLDCRVDESYVKKLLGYFKTRA